MLGEQMSKPNKKSDQFQYIKRILKVGELLALGQDEISIGQGTNNPKHSNDRHTYRPEHLPAKQSK